MPTKALTTTKAKALSANVEAAKAYTRASKAENTQRAYRAAWAEFTAFCAERGGPALPADVETVVAYLTALAGAGDKYSTISVKRAGIAFAHRAAGGSDPTTTEAVRAVMAGIARTLGTASRKKAPVTLDELRKLITSIDPDSLAGKRDRALLLVGYAGAFRRSELVALDVADIRLNGELKVTIRKSKTDQEGKGAVKVIPALSNAALCPVTAMRAWLDAASIKSGPIFRRVDKWGHLRAERLTAQSVAHIVKGAAEAAGLDPRQFSGHSLRSGFITSAANAGIESRDIMAQTGHKSEAVMRGYIQDAGLGAKRAVNAAFGEPVKAR